MQLEEAIKTYVFGNEPVPESHKRLDWVRNMSMANSVGVVVTGGVMNNANSNSVVWSGSATVTATGGTVPITNTVPLIPALKFPNKVDEGDKEELDRVKQRLRILEELLASGERSLSPPPAAGGEERELPSGIGRKIREL